MKHLFIFTFIITYIFFGLQLGYTATSPWYTHITYSFQHSGIIHLFINSVSFFFLFRLLEKYISCWYISLLSIAVAFTVSFFCPYSRVVVGSSGMIYAMLGIYLFLVAIKKIKTENYSHLFLGVAFITLSIIISFLKQNTAGMLHLICLLSGYFVAIIYYLFNKKF